MKYFAEIVDGKVVRVLNFPDPTTPNQFLGGVWVETVKDGSTRKNFAGIGYAYDPVKDAFIPPSPYPSWTLDDNCHWQPPVPRPQGSCYWDEGTKKWVSE